MKNFALIDNASGFVWWVGAGETPEAACEAATLETGMRRHSYREIARLESNEGGYLVYEAPEGFEVADGQSDAAITAVGALPFVGRFRQTDSE